jgi:thiamine biosynthesis lipoprotein ApbE
VIPLAIVAWLCGVAARPTAAAEDFAFFHENVMGTSLELRVLAADAETAQIAETRVLEEIDRLALVFSGYDPSSEFSRWQALPRRPLHLSSELFELLEACDRWRVRSGGAFDPRVEVLSRLWSKAARRDQVPSPGELDLARAVVAQPAWRLNGAERTAERLSDGPLSLNAIAKGEIVERACAAAMVPDHGPRGLLLNVGGDLRVCGDAPRTLGIASPVADSESSAPITVIAVKDRAVASSGSSQRGFRIQDRRYSHIIDPRTGMPADRIASATVVAPRSADADALATICNVLEPEESLRLIDESPDTDCLIIDRAGRIIRSAGWHRYEASQTTLFALADGDVAQATGDSKDDKTAITADSWGQEFELEVSFEINLPEGEGRRYRRPYVAIWVENKDGFPVRNLTLWVSMGGAGPFQWIPDLKRWYKADQARKQVDRKDMIFTMARPTRPPGKYKVIWDGKDDQKKPVARGEFTLFIDAAREHGTYQSIRKELTLGEKPFSEELKGGIEIKAASIDYRRKAPVKPTQ